MDAEESTSNAVLEDLKTNVLNVVAPSFCSGTLPLDRSLGSLFFKRGDGSDPGMIDFANVGLQDGDIQKLVDVCQQATFGRGDQDVLDESYRKAWKLDTSEFSTQFDIIRSGVMNIIHDQLLHYEKNNMKLEPHLYKLNIYGPGSFFKPHVDTPRSQDLFATLVVVFPTVHTGGNLLIGKEGSLLNFDSSKLLFDSESQSPQFAFAAFYSDIEHELLPVESGYRITLTYNLHLAETQVGFTKSISLDPPLNTLVVTLCALMVAKDVLPTGGALGFGLLYKYPVDPKDLDLAQFTRALKGNDALVRMACERIGLKVAVKVFYNWNYDEYIADNTQDERRQSYEERSLSQILKSIGGRRIYSPYYYTTDEDTLSILWVTPKKRMVPADASFMTYGNEYTMKYLYGDLVLVAEFPELKERLEIVSTKFPQIVEELKLKEASADE
ncbi:hypothetical protein EST38_g9649 [Candolleomyces aberdarensis]|uniref:Fe2OG dioxygenase domain-containing protein n=1 Tax=Candolleomyces aberdarensis TaxID=2316362 RepID=A0A4V1Q2T5_9AGAR|nr:hypothetical protein EST38_g9649 [Candolleomyces aberdarensis]